MNAIRLMRRGLYVTVIVLALTSVLYTPVKNGLEVAWPALHSLVNQTASLVQSRILGSILVFIVFALGFIAVGYLTDAAKRAFLRFKLRMYGRSESRVVLIPDGTGGFLEGIIAAEEEGVEIEGQPKLYRVLIPRGASLNWPNPLRPEGSFIRRPNVTPLELLDKAVFKLGVGNGAQKS